MLHEHSRIATGQGVADGCEQVIHLAIDNYGVQTFFAAEVFVNNRLRDVGLGCNLFNGDSVKALFGEKLAPDIK